MIAALDMMINQELETHPIVGLAVAVVMDGQPSWSKGYGYTNITTKQPATPDTPFTLASVSKVVVATAIMKAAEAGVLSLDADINTFLPFRVDNPLVPNAVMTLRHLATHTSGLADGQAYEASYVAGDPTTTLGDFLKDYFTPTGTFYDAEENFSATRPGEHHDYSNVGAALAAYIVEMQTGIPFNLYTEQTIFQPLGMENTHWFLKDFEDSSAIAVPHLEGVANTAHHGFPTYPDGLLRSSANDLARFLAAVMNEGELDGIQLLQKNTVTEMLRVQFPTITRDGEMQGFFWAYHGGLVGHEGGDPGVRTFLRFHPEKKIGVVVLINELSENAEAVGMNIIRYVMK
jgi:CubicO group peptidase (beta-lactamase class C family)